MELIGLYLVACVLLVVAGVAKAVHPADTARALAALTSKPLGATATAVRLGAVAEATLGVVALVIPRSGLAWAVALSYAGFAGFVTYARARGGALASCGCFGSPDSPDTGVHIVVDLVLAAAAVGVALARPSGSIVSVLAGQPGHGVALAVATALCAWLTYLTLSVLGRLQAVRRLTAVTFGER